MRLRITLLLAILMIAGLAGTNGVQAETPTPTTESTPTSDFSPPTPSVSTYTGPSTIEYTAPDTDGDGCPDRLELGPKQKEGGRRDPTNPWDWWNPTHSGKNTVADILTVVYHFGQYQGQSGYSTEYDRTPLGPNPWNLGPPDGRINVQDLVLMGQQYNHGCQPVRIQIDVLKTCNNSVAEAASVDPSFTGCVLYRNASGQINDVQVVSWSQYGEAASICTSCGPPPEDPGAWYSAAGTAEYKIVWPFVTRVCTPFGGYCWNVTWAEVTLLSYKMNCRWDYFDGPDSNFYDGVTVNHDCSDRPFSSIGLYGLESQDGVPAYTRIPGHKEVSAKSNGQIGVFSVSGVALRHYPVVLNCIMGPRTTSPPLNGADSYCWATG